MTKQYRIRNWAQFQHYKDRNPAWIKLHFALLASEDWVMLDDAGKLLAIVCMLVASRNNGHVPNNPAYLKRIGYLDHEPNLSPLISCGFLENPLADASKTERGLASARPEEETEEETDKIPDGFANAQPSARVDQKPEPQPQPAKTIETDDGAASDEDRFWARADEMKAKGIARSQMGRLANLLSGAFDEGLMILNAAAKAREPATYLAKIINGLRSENAPPPISDPKLPAWVIEARNYGYPVEREGTYWRFAGGLFDDGKQQVGN